jgi:hypothetical protein
MERDILMIQVVSQMYYFPCKRTFPFSGKRLFPAFSAAIALSGKMQKNWASRSEFVLPDDWDDWYSPHLLIY